MVAREGTGCSFRLLNAQHELIRAIASPGSLEDLQAKLFFQAPFACGGKRRASERPGQMGLDGRREKRNWECLVTDTPREKDEKKEQKR
jgi:hypothetical protein